METNPYKQMARSNVHGRWANMCTCRLIRSSSCLFNPHPIGQTRKMIKCFHHTESRRSACTSASMHVNHVISWHAVAGRLGCSEVQTLLSIAIKPRDSMRNEEFQ